MFDAQYDNEQYQSLRSSLKVGAEPLFTTDVTDLFDVFLTNLPDDYRQHYTCHACRKFVETYGGLVTINDKGNMQSAVWPEQVPELFFNSIVMMKFKIREAHVTGVFYDKKDTWGTPVTGEWTHFAINPPPAHVYRNLIKTPSQAMAEKTEDYRILCQSLLDFNMDIARQAVTLLEMNALYRSDRFLPVAKWLYDLHYSLQGVNGKKKDNLIWRAVATAPNGFCHIRSSVIGTLLEDLSTPGMTLERAQQRFADKVNPTQYQRSQVAPTIGNVQQAERIVQQLGLERSLQRRYITIDEIPTILWRQQIPKTIKAGGVFSNIVTKQKTVEPPSLEVPASVMTWDKFERIVLPHAEKIEIKVENSDRFAALVTALNPDAPSIFQWDNPVSWYYHSGIDAEMKRRVELQGGRYENVDIRATLIWDTDSDLDLHVDGPGGHIYYANKKDRFNGWLDVDANVGRRTMDYPVENTRWTNAPTGYYNFWVHNYSDRAKRYNPFKAELEVLGKIFHFSGLLTGTDAEHNLTSFYYNGTIPNISGNVAVTDGTAWGLTLNQFYPVAGIVKSPNLWGEHPVTRSGDHTFFLIEGCHDVSEGKGRGFFNEMLKPELREIRKTLEAYTASTPIEQVDNPACGLGYSKDGEWNVTIRVTVGSIVSTYKIDRFD